MRGFEAVDIDALHHLIDVVVFPAKGPRPHTDEMSGSDLDGDKYFVTWYDDLDPNRNNEDPMDFTAPKKKVLYRPVQVSDMIQFVADYIKNDQLGIIANAHTVHADSQEEGSESITCFDWSVSFSKLYYSLLYLTLLLIMRNGINKRNSLQCDILTHICVYLF